MFRSTKFEIMLSAAALAAALSGCADNRLNGGYNGGYPGEQHTITRLSATGREASAPSHVAQGSNSAYVYRGGRDPVTGKASLSY